MLLEVKGHERAKGHGSKPWEEVRELERHSIFIKHRKGIFKKWNAHQQQQQQQIIHHKTVKCKKNIQDFKKKRGVYKVAYDD